MKINSPRFGELEIAPDKVIDFPAGMPGFEALTRYSLFHSGTAEGNPNFYILQSIDDPEVAFSVTDPARFGFAYEISLSDEAAASIDLKDPTDAVVVVMLVKDETAQGAPIRANLQAPLIINLAARKGLQHVFSRLDYQVTVKDNA